MKRLFLGLLLAGMAVSASAQHRHWHNPHHHHRGHNGAHWVVPALIGGTVVYLATRPQPVIVQEPVYVEPRPVYIERTDTAICTEWREIVTPEGKIYRERACRQ